MEARRILVCLLLLTTAVGAKKRDLPRLHGASLLVEGFPAGLAVTTEGATLAIPDGGEWYVEPSISANGRVIASARPVAGDPPAARPRLIVATYSHGKWTDHKNLEVFGGTVAISPDGARIACVSDASARTNLFIRILDLNTGAITAWPESSRGAGPHIAWSPDGKRIVFDRDHEVYFLDVASGKTSRIARGAWPSWSPSGEWIAFLDYPHVLLAHPDGSGSRILARISRFESFGQAPVWSPDSQTILVQTPQDESVLPRMNIYAVDVASGKLTKVFTKVPPVFAWRVTN